MTDKHALDKVVYEGELVEETEVEAQMPQPQKTSPSKPKISYQLGKAAGSLAAVLGFLSEVRNLFKRSGSGVYNSPAEKMPPGRGKGRGGGRGRRKRWKQTRRGKCNGTQRGGQ